MGTIATGRAARCRVAAFRGAADLGEPWLTRFRPAELEARLRALGFPQITHLTPEAANDRYFKGRTDNLEAWSGEQMMRAVV